MKIKKNVDLPPSMKIDLLGIILGRIWTSENVPTSDTTEDNRHNMVTRSKHKGRRQN